jgi:hypothetical protein
MKGEQRHDQFLNLACLANSCCHKQQQMIGSAWENENLFLDFPIVVFDYWKFKERNCELEKLKRENCIGKFKKENLCKNFRKRNCVLKRFRKKDFRLKI